MLGLSQTDLQVTDLLSHILKQIDDFAHTGNTSGFTYPTNELIRLVKSLVLNDEQLNISEVF